MKNKPLIIAHRGASGYAKDNSLEAFLLAAKQGADIVEMDVRVTKDQVLVLNHANHISRLRRGLKVSSKTYQELKDMGLTFPKLSDVIKLLPKHTFIDLDLKSHVMDLALKALIKEKQLQQRVFFDTNNWFVLQRYQLFFPHAKMVLNNSTIWDPFNVGSTIIGSAARLLISALLFLPLRFYFHRKLKEVDTEYVALYQRLVKKTDIDLYHSLGIKVFVFVINSEAAMRKFIAMGVDGIKTDKPDLLYRVIHAHEG